MSKITYENKVALNENPSIADINKVKDTDMNEIKDIVNGNDNQLVIDNTEPEDLDNLRIWVNPDEPLQNVGTEVVNSLDGNETNMAPSVNAVKQVNKYSTEEIKTDKTWIDGKPIYRKVIDIGSLPNNTTKSISVSDLEIDEVINVKGFCFLPNRAYVYNLPHVGKAIANMIAIYMSGSNIVVETGTDRTGYSGYAIIEYTKTTD